MHLLDIARAVVHLDGKLITFEDRPYLPAIYASKTDQIVLRWARQTEKSTTLAICILLTAARDPSARILVVQPRKEQLRIFRETRLRAILTDSPTLWKVLGGRRANLTAEFWALANGAQIFFQSAYQTADSARGISATMLVLDEAQDLAEDSLPVLQQTLSHAPRKRVLISGTPKLTDNFLEVCYSRSTRNEWVTPCPKCKHESVPDERVLGKDGAVCAECGHPICLSKGHWVARNPDSTWGDGFWINNLLVPWKAYGEILAERDTYAPPQFRNEVLALPSVIGDYAVTQAEVEACCTDRPNALDHENHRRLGIVPNSLTLAADWGGGAKTRSAFALIGYGRDGKFHVLHLHALPAHADHVPALEFAESILRRYPGCNFMADGNGNGAVINRELLNRPGLSTRAFWSIFYADTTSEPREMSLGHK